MEKYKYVFVILIYRNSDDLVECLESIKAKVSDYKVVIVNAYYDDKSMEEIKDIAEKHGCDFLNIENKGYSFGNNRGIEFARAHYDFDYVIVSNPDIVIEQFEDSFLGGKECFDCIAPRITTKSGKQQNPMKPVRFTLADRCVYLGFKEKKKVLLILGIGLNKIVRNAFIAFHHIRKDHKYKIFCAHGSFVMLKKNTIEELYPVYDENLFLFAEEGVLATKLWERGLDTYYSDNIRIRHKEDGSMKLSSLNLNGELEKANLYVFEHYKMF